MVHSSAARNDEDGTTSRMGSLHGITTTMGMPHRRRLPHHSAGTFGLLGAGLCRRRHPARSTYVGEKTCIKCHDVEAKHFGHTLHAKIFRQNPRTSSRAASARPATARARCMPQRGNEKKRDYLIGFTREWGTPVEEQNAMPA